MTEEYKYIHHNALRNTDKEILAAADMRLAVFEKGELKIGNRCVFSGGQISCRYKITIGKGSVRIAQGKSDGFEPDEYSEPLPGNMDSALLPWQSVKSRTFRWDGKQFDRDDEEKWDPPVKKSKAGGTGS